MSEIGAIEVLCPADPSDAGRTRRWAAPAAAAWLIAAAEAGLTVDVLPGRVPDLHSHAGLIHAGGSRYVLLVDQLHPTLDVVRAVPEHPPHPVCAAVFTPPQHQPPF